MATKKLLTWKSLSRMGFIVLNYISKLIHIFISVVLFVEKVRKRFRGAKTRSPVQQVIFCIYDAQTVAPLKTCFCNSF